MKRLLVGVGLALTLALLSGFSLFSAAVQTQRVRWDAFFSGTVAPNTILGNFFGRAGDPTSSVTYGDADFRVGGISCIVSGTGTSLDGGTVLMIAIEHEDAGIDASCDLAPSACNVPGTYNCVFANGLVELGNAAVGGSVYRMRDSATSACNYSSGTIFCSADLFR